jgi:general stress protein 26
MLNAFAKDIIETFRLGFVASVTPDGRPNVSPKGTFLVLSDNQIGFADIRSPQTIMNIENNPEIEVNFVNQFSRKGIRVRGNATIAKKDTDSFQELFIHWKNEWPSLAHRINAIVTIEISHLKPLTTPPYDDGVTEEEMVEIYKQKFREIYP